MKDINTPLQTVYFQALNGNVPHPSGGPAVKVYEDQEPDNELADMYIVIMGRTSFDTSTKNSTDVSAQIQVTVNSSKNKYNNRKALNAVCNSIYQLIKPTPNAVLDMSAFNMQMLNLSADADNEVDYGVIANKAFVSRNIIFRQDIFIK